MEVGALVDIAWLGLFVNILLLEGFFVGAFVFFFTGICDGSIVLPLRVEGLLVGRITVFVGPFVGLNDFLNGVDVGDLIGFTDGLFNGDIVGSKMGAFVGTLVGSLFVTVGFLVGWRDSVALNGRGVVRRVGFIVIPIDDDGLLDGF